MAPNSLFAILLRSPWWISLALAASVALLARLLMPQQYVAAGVLGGFPFLVIAGIAAWKQWGVPSAAHTAMALERMNALSARELGGAIEAAFRSQGHEVRRLSVPGADLELIKGGRTMLLSWRRWKAASIGIEPLRELHAARQRQAGEASLCIAGGELSDKARRFANERNIRVMDSAELARLLQSTGALPKA